jgi:hypothetical protein
MQNKKIMITKTSKGDPLVTSSKEQYFSIEMNEGSSYGDPHFRTFDGCNFDFQGVGEYTYVAVENGEEFLLQVRQGTVENWDASVVIAVTHNRCFCNQFLL